MTEDQAKELADWSKKYWTLRRLLGGAEEWVAQFPESIPVEKPSYADALSYAFMSQEFRDKVISLIRPMVLREIEEMKAKLESMPAIPPELGK